METKYTGAHLYVLTNSLISVYRELSPARLPPDKTHINAEIRHPRRLKVPRLDPSPYYTSHLEHLRDTPHPLTRLLGSTTTSHHPSQILSLISYISALPLGLEKAAAGICVGSQQAPDKQPILAILVWATTRNALAQAACGQIPEEPDEEDVSYYLELAAARETSKAALDAALVKHNPPQTTDPLGRDLKRYNLKGFDITTTNSDLAAVIPQIHHAALQWKETNYDAIKPLLPDDPRHLKRLQKKLEILKGP